MTNNLSNFYSLVEILFTQKFRPTLLCYCGSDARNLGPSVFARERERVRFGFSAPDPLSRHSPFSLFLGLDRRAMEQGPWRKRKGVYTRGEARDRVKSLLLPLSVADAHKETYAEARVQGVNKVPVTFPAT